MPKPIVRIRVRGIEATKRELARLKGQIELAIARALFREGEEIMKKSKELVPVDTGALRSTGHVKPPEREGRTVTVVLSYGGPAGTEGVAPEARGRYVGYALYVHENLTARHKVGMAKFLERPAMAAVAGMAQRLAARVNQEVGL